MRVFLFIVGLVLSSSNGQAADTPVLRWSTQDDRNAGETFDCLLRTDGNIAVTRNGMSYEALNGFFSVKAEVLAEFMAEAARTPESLERDIDVSDRLLSVAHYRMFSRGSFRFEGFQPNGEAFPIIAVETVRGPDGKLIQRHTGRMVAKRIQILAALKKACGRAVAKSLSQRLETTAVNR